MPSSDRVKVEPQPNSGHDALQAQPTAKTSNTGGSNSFLTEEHTVASNERPNRLQIHTR